MVAPFSRQIVNCCLFPHLSVTYLLTAHHASWGIGRQQSSSIAVCHWPASGWCPSCCWYTSRLVVGCPWLYVRRLQLKLLKGALKSQKYWGNTSFICTEKGEEGEAYVGIEGREKLREKNPPFPRFL